MRLATSKGQKKRGKSDLTTQRKEEQNTRLKSCSRSSWPYRLHRKHSFDPDGDTVHLLDPVLLTDGTAIKSDKGKLTVWPTGSSKPRTIAVKRPASPYVPIRFEGIDAPEEHYRATPFKRERPDGTEEQFPFDPSKPHPELSQPQWKAATVYALRTLEKAGWAWCCSTGR